MAIEETHTDEEIDRLAEEIAADIEEATAKKSKAEVHEDDEEDAPEEEEEQLQTKAGTNGKKKGVSIKEKDEAKEEDEEEEYEEEVEENLANLGDKKAKPFKKKGAKTEEADSDEDEDEDEDETVKEELDITKLQKQEMIRNIFSQMQKTRKNKLSDSYDKLMGVLMAEVDEKDDEDEEVEEGLVSRAKVTREDIDVSGDIAAIFGSSSDELSEEFQTQVTTIFETAVITKINSELDLLEQTYAARLDAEKDEILEEVTEKVDTYLSYVIEEWMKENQLSVETGLKAEITEDFIGGLKQLFEEHYIELPEDKVEVVETLADKVDKLEAELNESIERNANLRSEVSLLKKKDVLVEYSDNLSDIEGEKLKDLAENIDYENEEDFREKLTTIKEGYFSNGSGQKTPKVDPVDSEIVEEDGTQSISPRMAAYAKVIGKTVENY